MRWMISVKILGLALVTLTASYLLVFGRALGQQADHIGIVFALPEAALGSGVARVDDRTYLAKDTAAFVEAMGRQGFVHVEQLGAGHLFQKDGIRYLSVGRMYSSHFTVFTRPAEVRPK